MQSTEIICDDDEQMHIANSRLIDRADGIMIVSSRCTSRRRYIFLKYNFENITIPEIITARLRHFYICPPAV